MITRQKKKHGVTYSLCNRQAMLGEARQLDILRFRLASRHHSPNGTRLDTMPTARCTTTKLLAKFRQPEHLSKGTLSRKLEWNPKFRAVKPFFETLNLEFIEDANLNGSGMEAQASRKGSCRNPSSSWMPGHAMFCLRFGLTDRSGENGVESASSTLPVSSLVIPTSQRRRKMVGTNH